MVLVIVVAVLALVLVAASAALLVARRRPSGPELEPPAPESVGTVLAPPRPEPETEPSVEAPPRPDTAPVAPAPAPAPPVPPPAPVKPSWRDRLAKARGLFADYVGSILSRSRIDQDTWDDLEEALIRADVGVGPATELLDSVRIRVKEQGIETGQQLVEAVKAEMKARLAVGDRSLGGEVPAPPGRVPVWLFVGVNGVGKTTSIGKVGARETAAGRRVMMAAGDTFRAAAAEQLTMWAQRAGADIVRGAEGADPASVIFNAIEAAASRHHDLVLADTAGRLHTKANLMEELGKVKRVASKPPGHVCETLLVLDATTGQNGLVQAQQFTEAVEVTGVVLTKLDGSAKGGIVFAIQSQLEIPVKLVGLGETVDDLVEFDPDEFVEALFSQ